MGKRIVQSGKKQSVRWYICSLQKMPNYMLHGSAGKYRPPGKHFRKEIQRAAGTPTHGQEKREATNISHKDYIKRNYASMPKHAA